MVRLDLLVPTAKTEATAHQESEENRDN